ncbi:AMP-dependent synthetase/ligase [Salinibacterium sp. SYSU T00001]|uniref:AMP-dependent synthetase/ligase n=1 Tax=Homoserinimonas sedimenticola TaxID=2986805 RepID=UPI002235E157|nr:AMP-dependent synthetase/ligase [Salinibacterium sedimenticola]MCW4384261.1 AMP-dependent synthetase/ligase [Salinibacterium sedimenticola]
MKEYSAPALVEADPNANTTDLLVDRVKQTPDKALFAIPMPDGTWQDVTSREFERQVIALAKGFVAAGIEPGERIALMAKTRYEWTLIDFAAWYAGAMLVPIYETSAPAQIQWYLTDSEAVAFFGETPDHFARFDEVRADLPGIRNVWQIDLGDIAKLSAAGTGVSDEEIERRRTLAKADDIATLIYTSGTTGKPKGVRLNHSNFYELARNSRLDIPEVMHSDSSTVLFITLAHVFARFISVLSIHGGVKVGHEPDTKKLLQALGSFRPTFLLAVPRVFEKVFNASEQKAEAGGKGKIFHAAAATAIEYSKALDAGKVPLGLKLKFAVLDRLVLSKLRDAMGGRVEYAVSGSAPLGLRLGHFYRALGLTILEGYGLTETTAPVTVNKPSRFKIGTVGPAIPGNAVRISEDGEVQAKGVSVFAGYWNNEQATKDTFDGEWFKTGDIGELDDDGYLTITGRKKEIIVTAGGKNVAPAVLEDPIRANPIIGQVIVVGDQKPFISALITLDEEMLPVWLNNAGEDATMSVVEAAKNPKVLAEIQGAIDTANTAVSRAESIRKFTILEKELTEASGHLTPKLSIKRDVILRDFAGVIEGMYNESPATEGISVSG